MAALSPYIKDGEEPMPEMTFQAAIWQDGESGLFRVQIRPYQLNGAKTYVAMMNAERLAEFIALSGAELGDLSEITQKKALLLEGVEVDDASKLSGFGFTLQQKA
jgi:hypothetical protein